MTRIRLHHLVIPGVLLSSLQAATYDTRTSIDYAIVVDGGNTIQLSQVNPASPVAPTPTTQLRDSTLTPLLSDIPVPATAGDAGPLEFFYLATAEAHNNKMRAKSILELEEPGNTTWQSVTAESFARGIFRDVYAPDLIYSTIPDVSGSLLRAQLWIKVSGGNFTWTRTENEFGICNFPPSFFPPGTEIEAITSIGGSFDGTPPAQYTASQWSTTNGRGDIIIPPRYIEFDVPWTALATLSEFAITLQTVATMTMDNPSGNLDYQPFEADANATWDATLEIIGMVVFDEFGNPIPGAEALISQTGYDYTLTEPVPDPAIDTNNDNIGDVYAGNFGVAGSNPGDDADGDGFSILEEEVFYTDPNDPTSFPHIRIVALGADSVSVDWDTVQGVGYRLESSLDGKDWTDVTRLLVGDGSVFTEIVPRTAGVSLFRLRGEVVDSDGDRLSDADEVITGTDPGNADQDGDGLDDGFEVSVPQLDPAVTNDPAQDADNNGQADVLDYAGFLGENAAFWTGPAVGDWNVGGNWSGGSVPSPGQVVLIDPTGAGNVAVTVSADAGCKALLGKGSLTIDAATFATAGKLFCEDLSLVNGATLTSSLPSHAHFLVRACGDVVIDAASEIDLVGLGYPAAQGPGAPIDDAQTIAGGTHGGRGGVGRFGDRGDLGNSYGSILSPSTLGSGPSRGSGQGGGAIRLKIDGNLDVAGAVHADGRTSGGAGGSIWIDCASFAGSGSLSAVGTSAGSLGGSGGGGRIAVYFDNSTFTGTMAANGGGVGKKGGAGSMFTKQRSALKGTLIFDNAGIPANPDHTITPALPGSLIGDFDLFVRGGAILSTPSQQSLQIITSGDITIDADSAIDVSGEGYPSGRGPGTAQVSGQTVAGGTHGGRGGISRFGSPSDLGASYGSIEQPADFGSGASRGEGSGGGAIRIDTDGRLAVAGAIRADGRRLGGAGGSIWVDCTAFAGSGDLSAVGGSGGSLGGSGGGGRIAVYFDNSSFAGAIFANGNSDGSDGGAGSIYSKEAGAALGTLRYDNQLAALPSNLINGLTPVGATLMANANIEVVGGARLTGETGQTLSIATPGSLTIAAESQIEMSAQGHGPFSGEGGACNPQPGGADNGVPNGASHAGQGGPGWALLPWCNDEKLPPTYGDFREPVDMGSGSATRGGGAIRLDVNGTLTVDGLISADGEAGAATGSGGSIWVTCDHFAGAGTVSAKGGYIADPTPLGGAGGGGRIAVYSSTSTFTGSQEALSNNPGSPGAGGTRYTDIGGVQSLIIDGGGFDSNSSTVIDPLIELTGDFVLINGAKVSRNQAPSDHTIEVIAGGDITIGAGSAIELSGRSTGDGLIGASMHNSCTGNVRWGGIGHGGSGGYVELEDICEPCPPLGLIRRTTEWGSFAYGSPYSPRTTGHGQTAGGAIILQAGGTLTVDGELLAHAEESALIAASGGSVFLSGETVVGSGTIDVSGGDSGAPNSEGVPFGGGGGGRIAVYAHHTIPATLTLSAGSGEGSPNDTPGSPGTIFKAQFPLNAVTGDIVEIAPPGDLRQDAREGDKILMFPGNEVQLEDFDPPFGDCDPNPYFGPVALDALTTGLFDEAADLSPAPLPDSPDRTSYILHADLPSGVAGTLTGTVTFDRDIVGVRALDLDSEAVGEILGAPFEKTFVNDNGLELDAGDSFQISPDRRTLTVTLNPGTGIDRLIVVTQHRNFNEWTP